MSTSLNVVSMAAVFCASFKRRAIVWRSLVMRTRSSRAASSGAEGARACTGAGAGAGGGAGGGGGGGGERAGGRGAGGGGVLGVFGLAALPARAGFAVTVVA